MFDPDRSHWWIEFDDAKRVRNLAKHGLDFKDAKDAFLGPLVTFIDDRFEYGEDRYITYAMLRGRVVVIAHTESDSRIRVISMRKANTDEQAAYKDGIGEP